MEIRRLRANETELYRTLRLRSMQESPESFISKYSEALNRELKDWELQANSATSGEDRNTIVTFAKGQPVGIASIYRNEETSTGEFIQLWVDPSVREQGIAKKIWEALLKWAMESDFTQIEAKVMKTNIRAQKFLESESFAKAQGIFSIGQNKEVVKFEYKL